MKSIFKSKTFWFNLITAAICPFIPAEYNNPVYVGYAVAAINIILRAISHEKIVLA